MKISGVNESSAGIRSVQMQDNEEADAVSKGLQMQIANKQKELKELSKNGDLSAEEKMKKRQELQKELNELQNQLRQHQMDVRRESQQKQAEAAKEMVGGGRQKESAEEPGGGSSDMQSILSADTAIKQAKIQGAVGRKMKGKANVLKSEIKQDAGRGGSAEKKKAELADLEAKAQSAESSMMNTLSKAGKELKQSEKAAERKRSSEDADETKEKPEVSENEMVKKEKSEAAVKEELPEGVELDLEKPVGNNVDAVL